MLHQHYDLDMCGLLYILYRYWIIVLFSGAFGAIQVEPPGSSNPDEDPDLTMSWFSFHVLTLPFHSACPRFSPPLMRKRRGRAGSRSTPSRPIRASPKWSPAHLISISPTDTAASTSRRVASRRSLAKGKIVARPTDQAPPTLMS